MVQWWQIKRYVEPFKIKLIQTNDSKKIQKKVHQCQTTTSSPVQSLIPLRTTINLQATPTLHPSRPLSVTKMILPRNKIITQAFHQTIPTIRIKADHTISTRQTIRKTRITLLIRIHRMKKNPSPTLVLKVFPCTNI